MKKILSLTLILGVGFLAGCDNKTKTEKYQQTPIPAYSQSTQLPAESVYTNSPVTTSSPHFNNTRIINSHGTPTIVTPTYSPTPRPRRTPIYTTKVLVDPTRKPKSNTYQENSLHKQSNTTKRSTSKTKRRRRR